MTINYEDLFVRYMKRVIDAESCSFADDCHESDEEKEFIERVEKEAWKRANDEMKSRGY